MTRSPTVARQPHFIHRGLMLAAILVGFALRLYHLGTESLWYDETVSVALAQKSIPALIRHTAGDIHPPGYYVLLHYWQAFTHPVAGAGLEFLYAWPSLACGLLIMTLLFAISRALATQQLALLALWLAAVNPYHIWYSQEVRMYTLGAWLGLLCLWAWLKWWCAQIGADNESPPTTTRIKPAGLALYVLAGAVGLYTLYYFLFILMALNTIALWLWRKQRNRIPLRSLGPWFGAQGGIALLWSPWLPIFWRQATEPPVPPWRVPWATGQQRLAALAESVSALISGQSAPAATTGYWLLFFFAILLVAYLYYANQSRQVAPENPAAQTNAIHHASFFIASSYLLLPMAAIYLITLWITPLYHVRYLFLYAPLLLLLVAAAILYLARRRPLLGWVTLITILSLNGWSLYNFWFTTAFQTDDHRAAVAQLAQAWRPGDALVVNAGWVYTVLTTYWPTTLMGVDAAVPPPLASIERLLDYTANQERAAATAPLAPVVVRTGSIEGASSLGWGDPASDFFAISAAATNEALFALAKNHQRLWHYRLYDTVNDPQGVIRTWFDYYTTMLVDTPIPGRDYLRLQLYQSAQAPSTPAFWQPLSLAERHFTGDLQLQQAALTAPNVAAGAYLYAYLQWQAPHQRTALPAMLSFSLRLYDEAHHLLAQADETPPFSLAAWPAGYALTLALPVPVATPPGAHRLVLIVYDQQTGDPVTVASEPPQPALPLGTVQVTPATQAPMIPSVQASFDYIDLVRARLTTPNRPPGASLDVELVWRPRENAYRDTYLAQLALQDAAGVVVGHWEAALGGWGYPSGIWPPLIPVRDWRSLPLDPALAPGQYTLTLQVRRASDQQLIPARQQWWQAEMDAMVIGAVEIE